jgi:Protein of unknown function (DUF3175)
MAQSKGTRKGSRKSTRKGASKSKAGVRGRSARSAPARSRRRWSSAVTEHSHALDLESKVFNRTPKEMARSLKRSAERSKRRKASPFQSAMSMLNFYENRAGRNLPAARKRKIQRAKEELRALYGRET